MSRGNGLIKVRFRACSGVENVKGYVSEFPDENGLHRGWNESSDVPVVVRWTGTEWVEVVSDDADG